MARDARHGWSGAQRRQRRFLMPVASPLLTRYSFFNRHRHARPLPVQAQFRYGRPSVAVRVFTFTGFLLGYIALIQGKIADNQYCVSKARRTPRSERAALTGSLQGFPAAGSVRLSPNRLHPRCAAYSVFALDRRRYKKPRDSSFQALICSTQRAGRLDLRVVWGPKPFWRVVSDLPEHCISSAIVKFPRRPSALPSPPDKPLDTRLNVRARPRPIGRCKGSHYNRVNVAPLCGCQTKDRYHAKTSHFLAPFMWQRFRLCPCPLICAGHALPSKHRCADRCTNGRYC